MKSNRQKLKRQAQILRRRGFSHAEIASKLAIPKGTIVFWNKGLVLDVRAEKRLANTVAKLLAQARVRSAETNRNAKFLLPRQLCYEGSGS